MRKKHSPLKFLITGALVLTIASVFVYLYVYQNLKARGPLGETVMVSVEQGDLLKDVTSTLKEHKLIGETFIVEIYAKYMKVTDFKAGVYKIDKGWDALKILTYMTSSANAQNDVALTIIPGDWAKDVAFALESITDYSANEILAYWNDPTVFEALDQAYEVISAEAKKTGVKVLLEGYLMPETYFIDPESSLEVITKRVLDQTEAFYLDHRTEFDQSDFSVHEIFTLASIVQFEASKETDMKMVTQVFINRLDLPMRLQSNVTICYALYNYTDWKDCEGNKDIDSPYNTYLHDGLPLGPIDNPSVKAILATLNPTPNDYFFFLADVYGDGTVYYTKTYAEHLKLVCKYLEVGCG
ncbi:MAG: hypothetical protein FD133_1467 [Erysipelotrichaceae bacterium]|nr:MAG: hypothetical protein FD133_1467 [Erysipelotrichaceae bacterium]